MGNRNKKPQPNSDNPKQDEEEEAFTCKICMEPVTLPNNKFKNSNKCIHPFCTECVMKYIQVKLNDNVSDIKCPDITCNHSLEPLSCRPKIAHQLFDKWCDLLCESAVLKIDRVYCTNQECSALILNECGNRNLKRCVCPDCSKPFCFRCKVPWHDAHRCKESWVTRYLNDISFSIISMWNGWMRCPSCRHSTVDLCLVNSSLNVAAASEATSKFGSC
ncbi:Zinc finger, C6HC-type [Cynara cardunculus var. scolymus]|uniref:RBR-type E3 ubiquitin transferase n=1 Tax=Cynara cardunculus var. scolymus TaxID=59895 RepID=A0A103YEM5_CYNCS|nr:Zinc finger, C6HC-type [Cynara cardunculus var. scolymus]